MSSASTFYDFKVTDKKGNPYPLKDLTGKVCLVVNTASKCGFTPQFKGLETLYQKIKASHPDTFTMIGFPCNQFLSQDPDTDDNIQKFCQIKYGVSFPIMAKINVNGDNAEPVFRWMKKEMPGSFGISMVKWNFEKFLIGADGKVKQRWASTTEPENLERAILKEVKKAEARKAGL